MQIKVTTSFETIDVNAWDELQIDKEDLDTEFQAIGGQIAYWIAVVAKYRATVSALQRAFDAWYGPLYEKEFAEQEHASGRKPNINSVEYLVKMNHSTEYNTRKESLENADADLQIIEGMSEGLRAKMQALIQIGKRRMVEYDHADTSLRSASIPNSSTIPQTQVQPTYRKPGSDSSMNEAREGMKGILGKTSNKRRSQ